MSLNFYFVKELPVSKSADKNEEMVDAMPPVKFAKVVSLDALRETLERPLFSKSRRRVAKKSESIYIDSSSKPIPIVAIESPSLQVIGIVLFENSRKALIRRNQGGSPEWISEKDKVDGWTLEGVFPTKIILKNDEQIKEFSLEIGEPLKKTMATVKNKNL
ncbi:MAG: hypothetical protein HQL91_00750 [Magnetococcales bacterium]|nr:hypothetical protein [Magnetococcales bacterium]